MSVRAQNREQSQKQDLDAVAHCRGESVEPALHALQQSFCPAAIWHRTLPESFLSWINSVEPDDLPTGRFIAAPIGVADQVQSFFEGSNLPVGLQRTWLESDVIAMAQQFATNMAAPYVRLRFDRISDNACSRFHVDAMKARLVCTYRGTGTQYGVVSGRSEPEEVETVPTGSPLLMRGSLWPEHPLSGFVHRSPPIKGSGETRFVLVLDPVDSPS